ncbi:MAG TPA: hypothetical protein VK875_10845 [Euzebyales bacterium]|nr:hypothetical protein [Euzebyales bacterium]
MPDIVWIATGRSVDPEHDCTAFAAKLRLRSHHDMPALLRRTADVTRQLEHAHGLLGYAIAPHATAGMLWTVSAWRHRTDLLDFERSHAHRAAMRQLRDLLAPSTLAVWTSSADQLPIGWGDVHARITAIDARASDRPDRRPTDS